MVLLERYKNDGYISPVKILDEHEAALHRQSMEDAEQQIGALHYKSKIHTILTSPLHLARHPAMLDIVEQIIGPDILIYNVTYIVKQAQSAAHVSWHQDLTYWGLDSDDQVSAWLALSAANEKSGCMRMIPGSHCKGRRIHDLSQPDKDNVLFQSQTVRDVDESAAVVCALRPGEASFHHGWTLHSSLPNRSDDRRIGLNIQYIATHVRQTKLPGFTALLVRGADRHCHYVDEIPATEDLNPVALRRRDELESLHQNIAGKA